MEHKTQAFNQGYQAYENGAELNGNPYKMTQLEYGDWEDGYLTAMDDDYSFDEHVGSS